MPRLVVLFQGKGNVACPRTGLVGQRRFGKLVADQKKLAHGFVFLTQTHEQNCLVKVDAVARSYLDLLAEQAPIRLQGCAILSHVMVGARKLSTHPAARIAHTGRFGKGPIELGGCAVFAQ